MRQKKQAAYFCVACFWHLKQPAFRSYSTTTSWGNQNAV